MTDTPALKIAGAEATTAPSPDRTGRWITAKQASERSGLSVGHVNRLAGDDWQHTGLARWAKLPSGQQGWLIDEGADARFVRDKSAERRAAEFDWNTIPEKPRTIALWRLGLLKDWKLARESAPKGTTIDAVAESFLRSRHLDLSVRSLHRLQRRFIELGVPYGLLDHRVAAPSRTSDYADFYAMFRATLLEFGQAAPTTVYKLVCAKIRTQKIDFAIPTDRQARNFAATIPLGEMVYHRQGPKAFDDKCAAFCARDWTTIRVTEGYGDQARPVTRPMETNDIWIADHHPCDVIVKYEGKLIRPWLTAWQDGRSRRVVGRWFSPRDPNSSTVLLSLRDAILRNELLVPLWAYTDNGKDFDAWMWDGQTKRDRRLRVTHDQDRFGGVYQQLQIGHLRAKPYNAKAKPVERFFGTFERQVGVFEPTYCGRNPMVKPERLADRLARGLAPDYADFVARATAWIDDVYPNNTHTGQGLDGQRPIDVYNANLHTRRVTTLENLDCCLQIITRPIKVGRNGVTVNKRTYGRCDPALRNLLGREVQLRIDPEDVRTAQVWTTDGKQRLCVVSCNELAVLDVTSDAAYREGLAIQTRHNNDIKRASKRGLRMIESPIEILRDDAIARKRADDAKSPPPGRPAPRISMIQTGIDAASIAEQPVLAKAAGAEHMTRAVDSTLAMFAADD
ncbi:MAG TPA: transposase [Tepidisphaeraceae bacterium]